MIGLIEYIVLAASTCLVVIHIETHLYTNVNWRALLREFELAVVLLAELLELGAVRRSAFCRTWASAGSMRL